MTGGIDQVRALQSAMRQRGAALTDIPELESPTVIEQRIAAARAALAELDTPSDVPTSAGCRPGFAVPAAAGIDRQPDSDSRSAP
jgi:hypothetical protein